MVYYRTQALNDLDEIFEGLLTWQTSNYQKRMTYEEVINYHTDIRKVCDALDKIAYHNPVRYKPHLNYGNYVFTYQRNKRTAWYIIYNKTGNCIFVEKIINNYKTID